jgi:VWFA-related protein
MRAEVARRCTVACAITMISAGWLGGQSGAPTQSRPAAPPTTVLRATTHLVQVNVVVQDGHGDPVTDLKQSDFTLFDNGKPQSISIFQLESGVAPATLTPLPLNTFSNVAQRQPGSAPTATIILLDALNTPTADQQNARNQVIRFIHQLRPDDRIGLCALDNRLRVLQDFTGDANALLTSLAQYKGYVSPQLAASTPAPVGAANPLGSMGSQIQITLPAAATAHGAQGPTSIGSGDTFSNNALAQYQRSLEDSRERQADLYIGERVRRTAAALRIIAEHVAAYPGRKNLVWVSGGFPYWVGMETTLEEGRLQPDQISFDPDIRSAARVLNSVNIAIYPVDARGLMVSGQYDASQEGTPSAQNAAIADGKAFNDLHSTMDELAALTGGRAFYGTNDIGGAVRRAIDDSRVSYLLGYYPQGIDWKGETRTITLKVDRGSLSLHYRQSYVALPDETDNSTELRATLLDALHSPLAATAVGLTAHASWDTNPQQPPHTLDLAIHVDPSDVSFQPDKDRWKGSVTVATAALDSAGAILNVGTQTFTLGITPETHDKVLTDGLTLQAHIAAPANTDHLRIVVRDDLTSALGSVNIPLDKVIATAAPPAK